jgi:hypothetical protein
MTEIRESDIERNRRSLIALFYQGGSSVYSLIDCVAESLAYQYALNRENSEIIRSFIKEQRRGTQVT